MIAARLTQGTGIVAPLSAERDGVPPGPPGRVRRAGLAAAAVLFAACLVLTAAQRSFAEERSVTGTIERIDAAQRTFSVRDGMGIVWSYRVDRDAGIRLADFAPGDRVTVSLRRATPLNMSVAADRVRRGDRIERSPLRAPP